MKARSNKYEIYFSKYNITRKITHHHEKFEWNYPNRRRLDDITKSNEKKKEGTQ